MRRSFVLSLSLVVLLGTVVVSGSVFAAQEATPTDYAGHPFVGSWEIDPEPDNPDNLPELGTTGSDGTMIESAAGGGTGHGVWEPTGATTAVATFTFIDEDGFRGIVRTTVEVAPDGQSFTGAYTFEFFDPETGEWSGEIGPATVIGTRITLEPPGTPVASFEEVFGAPEGSPEATPAG